MYRHSESYFVYSTDFRRSIMLFFKVAQTLLLLNFKQHLFVYQQNLYTYLTLICLLLKENVLNTKENIIIFEGGLVLDFSDLFAIYKFSLTASAVTKLSSRVWLYLFLYFNK